jgi:diacylglycerol kinase family enzyme
MKKALFLINPVSGGRSGESLKQSLEAILRDLGEQTACDTAFTRAHGPSIFQGDFAAYDSIIAAGGDGTAARIVQELARREKKPRLGIIPIGTGNDLARVSGAYRLCKQKGLRPLVESLLAGRTRRLDVFSVNGGLFFTNYCGIGLDAKISNDYNRLRHSPIMCATSALFGGRAAYAWFSGRNLLYHMPFALELQYADTDKQHRMLQIGQGARQVLVTSIPSYAAGARPTDCCRIDDGLFEVTVVETLQQWFMLHMTRFVKLPLPRLLPSLMQFQAKTLTIRFSGATCFQADGELYGGLPAPGSGLTIQAAAQLDLIFV